MLKRVQQRPMLAGICLFVIGLVLLTWGVTFSASYKQCEASNRAYASSQEESDLRYWIGSFIECESVFANENGEAITGLSTVVLTISTILLWIATRDAAKIAERSLSDLERPWLLVTEVDSDAIFSDTPRLVFLVTNYGKQAAIITGISGGAKATITKLSVNNG